ncbi:MAG: molybdate-binding protein, partial [Acidimicrobiales bacterium]
MTIERRLVPVLAVLMAVVAACSGAATPSPTPPPVSLTVYAASSLTAAFGEIKTAYQTANPGVTLTMS